MEHQIRVLNAECPVCEHFGPHWPSGNGAFTCELCKTTFGTGRASDESVLTVDDDDGQWAKRDG
jgi:hypothetical protein